MKNARKSILVHFAAVALILAAASAGAQDRIRVGLSSISATSGSIWVAEEKGLFKKHGANVEVIFIGGGASRVVSALLAGEIQFSVGGGDAVIRAALRGAETVLAFSPMNRGLQRLIVRPDIRTPAELKGKRVSITRFGSAGHWAFQLFVKRWGMRPEDFVLVQLEASPAMFANLEKGGTEGSVLTMPSFFVAEEKGYRTLADPAEMDIYYLQNSVDSTRSYLKANRAQAVRFAKGLMEGIAYFKKYKKESVEVLQKKLRIQSAQEKDLKYLESSYNLLATKYYNPTLLANPKAIEASLEFIAASEPKARGADARLFVDESIVKEIEASGFIKQLYEGEYR
jgi:NitT/TauT family transport system substrate-binding protein